MPTRHWLLKTEPSTYSIDDLAKDRVTTWEGIRNAVARNHLRAMRVKDLALVWHSSAKVVGVAGLARIVREAYPDTFAADPASPYFDPATDPAAPRWVMVDVELVEAFPVVLTIAAIKATRELADMVVVRNSRLSVQPVLPEEYRRVVAMCRALARGE